jgi:hypothetical protein
VRAASARGVILRPSAARSRAAAAAAAAGAAPGALDDVDAAIADELAAQRGLDGAAGGGGGGELAGNPVPGMRALLRLVCERGPGAPAATLRALDAALAAADTQQAGAIDDERFAAALRAALPALSRDESRAVCASMHLQGARSIDYYDFSLALSALAAEAGLLAAA